MSPANKKRALIAAAASLLVWVVATIVFVVLRLLPEPPDKAWLAFIYALPATMIVLTVFSVVWKMRLFVFCAVSLLIWTMCLTLFVSIIFVTDNAWLLFIIGIPLQILNIVWFFLLKDKNPSRLRRVFESNYSFISPSALACKVRPSRNLGCAMEISFFARSETDSPMRFTAPYSVTMYIASLRWRETVAPGFN